jgi:hypothetical protein
MNIYNEDRPWSTVPQSQRSIVRCYINSEKDVDKEHARALCVQYDLDYTYMRKLIFDEMVAYEKKRLMR